MNILNTSSLNYVGHFIQRWHKTALYTCSFPVIFNNVISNLQVKMNATYTLLMFDTTTLPVV